MLKHTNKYVKNILPEKWEKEVLMVKKMKLFPKGKKNPEATHKGATAELRKLPRNISTKTASIRNEIFKKLLHIF